MYNWGTKFLAAFNGNTTRDKVIQKYKKEQTKQLFVDVLAGIKDFMTKLKQEQVKLKIIVEL